MPPPNLIGLKLPVPLDPAEDNLLRDLRRCLPCQLKSIRVHSVDPGTTTSGYFEPNPAGDTSILIHIPVLINRDVEFYICGKRLLLEEGSLYFINRHLPQRLVNRGDEPCVHLSIEAILNDDLRALLSECMAARRAIPRSSLPPRGFADFAGVVFADPNLRDRLRAIPCKHRFLQATAREAQARGLNFTEADLEFAFRCAPQQIATANEGWLPIHISFHAREPRADCIYAEGHRFTESFFEDAVRTCLLNPFTQLFRREMPLHSWAAPNVAEQPSGFIFHMSRCGSTLISRSLAAAESLHVISEPAPLDAIVQAARSSDQCDDWLRWIVAAAGQMRSPRQTQYLIKLDAWHIRSLPFFRRVFPEVPWIFVFRDPLEILVSHLQKPGLLASPGAMDPAILGMRTEEIAGLTRQQWCARVLEGLLQAALDFRDEPKGLFVHYSELPGAITGKIASHFNLRLGPEDTALLEAAARIDSKSPHHEFTDDREPKRQKIKSLAPDPSLESLSFLYETLLRRAG